MAATSGVAGTAGADAAISGLHVTISPIITSTQGRGERFVLIASSNKRWPPASRAKTELLRPLAVRHTRGQRSPESCPCLAPRVPPPDVHHASPIRPLPSHCSAGRIRRG